MYLEISKICELVKVMRKREAWVDEFVQDCKNPVEILEKVADFLPVDLEVLVETDEGISGDHVDIQNYLDTYMPYNTTLSGIIATRHEHLIFITDVVVWAKFFLQYYERQIVSTLGDEKSIGFSKILDPLGVVFVNKNCEFEDKRNALELVANKGYPYLGLFVNYTIWPPKQKIGIGAVEWSLYYDLPIIPVGIKYSNEKNLLPTFFAPYNAELVFGTAIPVIPKYLFEFDGSKLKISPQNKFMLKSIGYDILKKTFDLVDKPVPKRYLKDLREAQGLFLVNGKI